MSNEQPAQPEPAPEHSAEPASAPSDATPELKDEAAAQLPAAPASEAAPRKADAAKIEQAFAKDAAAEAAASPVLRPITRGDCTLLGAKLFGGATVAAVLLAAVLVTGRYYAELFVLRATSAPPLALDRVFNALYFTVLPMALLGGCVGFEIYRVLACSKRPLLLPGWAWFLFTVLAWPYFIAFWFVLPLYLQSRLRERVLHGVEGHTGAASVLHLIYLVVWTGALVAGLGILAGALGAGQRVERLYLGLGLCLWSILWLGDYALVMAIASWRSTRILAPAKVHTVQFTLGALMMFIFVVGAWVAGLVKMFE